MRPVLVLAATILLAACGGASDGGDDFSFDVAMTPDKARAELGRLDGGDFLRALYLAPITAQRNADGGLTFALPGERETGTLRMRFEETGTKSSRVHVRLDLPGDLTRTIRGERMVLSESRVEASLKKDLQSWARAIDTRGYASLDALNLTLGSVSVVLRPGKYDELLAAQDAGTLASQIDPAFLAEAEGGSDYGYDETEEESWGWGMGRPMADPEYGMGRPMVDPGEDLSAASAPMDDADGVDPNSETSETY